MPGIPASAEWLPRRRLEQTTLRRWVQESYFVVDDLNELHALAHIDFAPRYAYVTYQPEYEPGDLLAADHPLARHRPLPRRKTASGGTYAGRRPSSGLPNMQGDTRNDE